MDALGQFRRLAQPPPWALKQITGGRLRGMTDIKPAWRVQAMTEVYGLCGVGWKYRVVQKWTEQGCDNQVFAFVDIELFVKIDGEWSEPIPGTGGNLLVQKETAGLHANDEAFKMAFTDALSSAMRMIGMGADVYAGQWNGSKYQDNAAPRPQLSAEDQVFVAKSLKAIEAAVNQDELATLGEVFRDQNPPVQNALRGTYAKRQRELKET